MFNTWSLAEHSLLLLGVDLVQVFLWTNHFSGSSLSFEALQKTSGRVMSVVSYNSRALPHAVLGSLGKRPVLQKLSSGLGVFNYPL